MNKKLATVISRIFDPFITFAVALVAVFYKQGEPLSTLGLFILLGIGVPFLLTVIALKKHMIGNWDISERRERPKFFGMLLVVECIILFLMKNMVTASTLHFLIFIIAGIVGLAVITLFWKISGHMAALALATGTLIALFGPSWWPVLLIVPVVGWARVIRKDHTILQVAAGALYSWSLLILFGKIFNF